MKNESGKFQLLSYKLCETGHLRWNNELIEILASTNLYSQNIHCDWGVSKTAILFLNQFSYNMHAFSTIVFIVLVLDVATAIHVEQCPDSLYFDVASLSCKQCQFGVRKTHICFIVIHLLNRITWYVDT